jgi:hypothetical protein
MHVIVINGGVSFEQGCMEKPIQPRIFPHDAIKYKCKSTRSIDQQQILEGHIIIVEAVSKD